MKICVLGTGSWGFCLANLLAGKDYDVCCWTTNPDLLNQLNSTRIHPKFPDHIAPTSLNFSTDLSFSLKDADLIVESVTAAGVRPVFNQIKSVCNPQCPIVITSKGIEQNTGLFLSEVIIEILGQSYAKLIGYISGPSYAQEVIKGLPTSVVGSSLDSEIMNLICNVFATPSLRVYPNADMRGVALGGALKNIIAIACGIADGLNLGNSAKAALMTRGLHEMRKLAVAEGCMPETLNGLTGMGDLFVTCSSSMSRNFRFGQLLAQGYSAREAQEKIGMVVEGTYTCLSALQLSQKLNIPMPITQIVEKIVYEGLSIQEALLKLMQRNIKEEHL